jgi:hypothetical protein
VDFLAPSSLTAKAGPFSAPGPLAAVNPNVNAPDFIQQYSNALARCSVLIPEGVQQVGSFAFDYRDTEEEDLEADIPDHWLEDNTAVHDHIAVKPVRVTLSGFVGELVLPAASLKTILGTLTVATNQLAQLPIFLGAQTAGNQQALERAISQAQSVVVNVGQSVARAAQLANLLSGLLSDPARNKQQRAFAQLKAYQQAAIIFTVHTPFETLTNMAIEQLRAVAPPDSKDWSQFTVRLKQLQFVGAAAAPNYAANLSAPVALAQGQQPTNVGATAGAALGRAGEALSVASKLVVA